jgi:hypothetical protein
MFSRTVSPANGWTIWKVRAMPRRASVCGGWPVMSVLAYWMRPAVGGRKPETTANSVVLPAPFGPISAVMRPVSAVNDALSTASNPPKRFDTFST